MPTVEPAVLIWMILLLVFAGATAIFAVPRRDPNIDGPAPSDRPRKLVARPEADRYAEEVAAAAEQAAVTARSRREAWERAQEAAETAWAAFDEADRIARRSAAAAVFPVFKQRRTRAEIADRERFLHRKALAATRRRELSMDQLNDVLAHRDGWNPRKHPVAQETALRAAVREHRFAGYQAATERERYAWQESEKAATTLRGLRAEALAAKIRAGSGVVTERRTAPIPAARASQPRLAVH
ncbi:hypothetical protein Ahu01nite_036110 [Winogradskya humida]|uniref:Uncharacterized protein n=1 Tax=Winogradskya humida TaxID=113566 RepID=A0ABQ3ZPJ2_9ACTN|nr:hypothetical protein Ahu01nite_036110 [Actinoplanes humidus]